MTLGAARHPSKSTHLLQYSGPVAIRVKGRKIVHMILVFIMLETVIPETKTKIPVDLSFVERVFVVCVFVATNWLLVLIRSASPGPGTNFGARVF